MKPERLRDSLPRGIVISYLAMGVQIPFSILSQTLLSRAIGVEAYGEFGILQTIVFLLFPFAALCGVYGTPMFIATHSRQEKTAHTALLLFLGFFLALLLVTMPLWMRLLRRFGFGAGAQGWEPVVWLAGAVGLAYRAGVELILVGQQDFLRRGIVILFHPITFALGVVMVTGAYPGLTSEGALYLWTGSILLSAAFSWLLVHRHLEGESEFDLNAIRTLGSLGFKGSLVNFALVLLFRSPFFTARVRMTPVFVGLWNSINMLLELLRQTIGVIGRVMIPFAAQRSVKRPMLTVFHVTCLLLTGLFSILLAFPTSLTQIVFGKDFADPDFVLLSAYPGLMAASLNTVLTQTLAGWGYPFVTYVAPATAALLGVGLCFLVQPLPPTWFGLAFSIALWFNLLCHLYVYHRGERMTLKEWFDLRSTFVLISEQIERWRS